MGSTEATKSHAVCIPFPAQGHVTPMMQLAKLLHSKGFHVTFVNTEFNHLRLIRSKGPDALKGLPDFNFETIPDGLPPSDRDATQDIPALCDSTRKNCLAPFLELLKKLNSSGEQPPVTCVVADAGMSFGAKAARVLGIADATFWTASACGLVGYWQYAQLVKRGIIPFNDENFLTDETLDAPLNWIHGMSSAMRLKDLPRFMRVTDLNDIMFDFLKSEVENCMNSSTVILNTFDELEQQALDVISSKCRNIYTIGPLSLLGRHLPESNNHFKSFSSSLWKEDSDCLKWLDKRDPNSVVYVNYGSITVMSEQHLKEFAWGLANSKHPFLWIVRPDVVMGGDDSAILPQEYFEEIKDRGLVESWCSQDQVLLHPSVGAFLTHCGWNSTLESIIAGKPVICWPFFAEQQTNCRYACTTWEIGMEVNQDVKREEIETLVKEMMEGEKGKKMRKNVIEWGKKALAATEIGGKSYNNFERCMKEALHQDENFLTDETLDAPLDWIHGMSSAMRLKDLPSFMRVTDLNDIMFDFLKSEVENCMNSSTVILNTFDELEQQALDVISSKCRNIYTIGPLSLLGRHLPESNNHFKSFSSSLWKEDSDCLKWLDKRDPNSVVYVNYGSITVMSEQHLKEFAWGLANSKHPFLWIVRPDVVMGGDDYAILPQEYFEEIKDRGLVESWCSQDQVLLQPSVGAFLTHCGWNSTLESIIAGKPVICWPFFAEQQTNCRYACTT
ncbi:hypothetical protein Ddye_009518 [Dipteronia dyeriana]|uniref:Glycosyltransferase N-terminal domain-containing protein n=1 Tax=Dipteronia dyeriana TaxID=168575 RepID=A0AAD9XC64_9ROSI|nr:hypothetical protein Ddye_009518 [Dipteronia dyeriana]